MRKSYSTFLLVIAILSLSIFSLSVKSQVIISQYYKGAGTNKWIELTNMGSTSVNTASPQLKLGLWPSSGTTGSIKFSGSASQTVNLIVTIPAKGTVLIGNTANGTEVPYLTASSAAQTSNTVINFDGNDGIALLNSSNTIIDKFGQGINANNISYIRNSNITLPTSTFSTSQWTSVSLATVQTASATSPNRLGFHIIPSCTTPVNQPSAMVLGSVTTNSIAGSFTSATGADAYLVVRSSSTLLTSNPIDGNLYSAGNSLGGGIVVANSSSSSFTATGLNSGTNYYFFVFSVKSISCSGGPKYLTANPLTGNATTTLPACAAPSAQPTAFSFANAVSTSISGSFSASGANEYLVVMSAASTISAAPVNGIVYNSGDAFGGGTVITRGTATSFSATGLNSNTTYYFFIFALNNTACTGGPVYLTASPLSGSQTTLYPSCVTPLAQSSAFTSSSTYNSIDGSFAAVPGTDGYLVLMSTVSSLTSNPVNGTIYTAGNSLGGGTVISAGANLSFTATGLNANSTYYFFVYSYNNSACSGGPLYLTPSPLTGNQATTISPCAAPPQQPTAISFSSVTASSINGSFTTAGADEYLVLMTTNSSLSANPTDGIIYNSNDNIGGAIVVQRGVSSSFSLSGLSAATAYYVFVFSLNSNCSGGPVYLTTALLSGSQITSAVESTVLNFYNGNLHSHSSYSDGNSDNTTRIPADDYAFAKTALCMDFLGISEHNHATAGMHLADWQPGIDQAIAATSSNFVALHGMEWGVIGTQGSAGDHAGHVIVYGMDSLIGWEAANYQIYVPKSTYTGAGGLFEILNRHGGNALAYCAHPDNYDYNNLLNITYDVNADNALVGTAVESGPAFSTDTTYTNQAASLSYYTFYKNMLAKGYHVGPTIDHDNHNFTFGHTAKSRLVILATSLSENNLLDAMRRMRFYATEDCGAKINFTVNTQPLGSILRQVGAPAISINTITSAVVSSIKLMYGIPGSGSAATTLTSTTTGTLNFTHTALANLATGYYFADITETNGARIITAPVWYTRDDLAARPVPMISFFTINEPDRVVLKWVTSNEPSNQFFEIERSADGRNFTRIGSLQGKGANSIPTNYAIEDRNPVNGIAYYRLLQKNAAGNISYSEMKVVDRGLKPSGYITIYPNPVHGLLTIKLFETANETTLLELYDMAGRRVGSKALNLISGEQNLQLHMSALDNGSYIIKIRLGKEILTRVVNKF